MIVTTTSVLEGKKIVQYYGLVNGEAILGSNIFRDILASVRDIIGGRTGGYEKSLRQARETAVSEMIEAARALGANAIIGVDIDYEAINMNDGGNLLMVSASGTAVKYVD